MGLKLTGPAGTSILTIGDTFSAGGLTIKYLRHDVDGSLVLLYNKTPTVLVGVRLTYRPHRGLIHLVALNGHRTVCGRRLPRDNVRLRRAIDVSCGTCVAREVAARLKGIK